MLQRTGSACALTMERLEDKNLLAGDVSVAIVNGDVHVQGDDAANHVRIVANPVDNQLVIVGLPSADGTDTTINGQSGPVLIDGLNRALAVRTGAGNDAVDLPGGRFQHVNVATGPGADLVRVGRPAGADEVAAVEGMDSQPGVVMQSLNIHTGSGPDRVVENNLFVAGNHRIATDRGADLVALGGGRDATTDPVDVRVGGNLQVQLAEGDDRLSAAQVQVAGHTHFNGGLGNDGVRVVRFASPGALGITTGPGADYVALVGARVANVGVDTGYGNDHVAVIDSAFANLGVSLGDGADRMAVGDTTVAHTAIVNGGAGRDALALLGGNQAGRWRVEQVERLLGPGTDANADSNLADSDETDGDETDSPNEVAVLAVR